WHRDAARLHNRRNKQHVWTIGVHFEIVRHTLAQNRRCERPVGFPEFDLQIHNGLHLHISSITKDAPTAKGARTELHTTLEPANYFAGRQFGCDAVEDFMVADRYACPTQSR